MKAGSYLTRSGDLEELHVTMILPIVELINYPCLTTERNLKMYNQIPARASSFYRSSPCCWLFS